MSRERMPSSTSSAQTENRTRHVLYLLFAQLVLSSGPLFGRLALASGRAPSVAAARMALVSVPLVVRHLLLRRGTWGAAIEGRLALAAFLLAAQFSLWTQALSRLSVGITTLLVCCTPLWNSLFDVFVRGRRLPVSFWVAMLVALGGVGLLVTGNAPSDVPIAGQTSLGIALACTCSLSSATYLLLIRQVTRLSHRGESPPMLDIITRTFVGAAVVLAIVAISLGEPLPGVEEVPVWASIFGMALVTQGIGHTMQNIALENLAARTVGFATLLEPLIATLAAALFFDEKITTQAIGGGILILVALGWALRVSDG